MIEEKDIDLLRKVFDDRYRKVDDCNEIMAGTDKRQDTLEKAFTASNTKLNVLIGILSSLAALLAPVCVKIIFGG